MTETRVTDIVLAELLTSLDLVVLERLPEGVFRRIGSAAAPAWFASLFDDAAAEGAATLAQALPFVGAFLADAEQFWRDGRAGRLRSEGFTFVDSAGRQTPLVASAILAANTPLLVLERPADFEEHRRALQTAREHELGHEEHLQRTRALLTPAGAAEKAIQDLAATALTSEQQALVRRAGEQLAALSVSIRAIAPALKGVSRPQPR